jgi:hypothetical protein
MPAHLLREEDRTPVCADCRWEDVSKAFEHDLLNLLEEKLGLTEENKDTLQALMSIIENPDRVVMVARLHDRVDELERRLTDRTDSLRDSFESKLEEANTRLFFAMLIVSVLALLLGLAIGVVGTLAFGV